MKKIIYLLLSIFVFASCNQDGEPIDVTLKSKQDKVTVCHKGKIINISSNALNAHLNHGDVSLVDADGDGYVVDANECGVPSGDCDDFNAEVNPDAVEICDGIDNNCDGNIDEGVTTTFYQDSDVDGFGNPEVSQEGCSASDGWVGDNTDCDDSNVAINPGAEEICDNGIDDNCDGNIDEGCEETEGVFHGAGGIEYKWVKIGNQIWMAENVAYERYSVNYWFYRGLGITDYAHLYTWEDAMTNCCSDGWHLPSDAEWTELSTFLIDNGYGYGGSGDDIAQSLSALSYWGPGLWPGSPRYGGHDDSLLNNTSGFSALPAGYGYKPDGDWMPYPLPYDIEQIFSRTGDDAHWWSSTEHDMDDVYVWDINRFDPGFYRNHSNRRTYVLSVRCVKD